MAIDTVIIRGIRLDASIGLLEWERQIRQPLEVDVDADVDTSALLRSGELTAGVDFTTVIAVVRDVVLTGHVDLVEVVADRIARAILQRTPALGVRVEVRKYSACANAAHHVGVRVARKRGTA